MSSKSSSSDAMYFECDTLLTITDVTRRFRVNTFVVDTWVMEGLFPEFSCINGTRYWDSNEVNKLIPGSPVHFPKQQTISEKTENSLLIYSSALAIILFLVMN